MKRFWIGIFLLAMICAAGIYMLFFSDRFCQELTAVLDEAKAFAIAENWDAAAEKAHAADTLWQQHHRFFSALTDHEPVEEAQLLLQKLHLYGKNRMRVDFVDICQSLSLLCEAINESHNLKWWSVL